MGNVLSETTSRATKGIFGKKEPYVCQNCGTLKEPYLANVMRGKELWLYPQCPCDVETERKRQEEIEREDRERRIESLYGRSGLSKRLMTCTLESFQVRPGTERAFKAVAGYVETFEVSTEKGLLLMGGYGNGKSHLAAAICHALIEREFSCRFWTVPQLLGRIRSTFNQGNRENEEDILRPLRHCDLLVLDDIGTEKVTDWVSQTLFVIIDDRYQAMKPIVFTTNCTAKELEERVGGKTYSRIIGMTEGVVVGASDYRKRHLKGGE